MRIKLGIEFNDKNLVSVNASEPENGNPGIGGSEYLFALLGRYLQKNSDEFEIYFFNYGNSKLPQGVASVNITDNVDMLKKAEAMGIDILIHQVSKSAEWYQELEATKLKAIPWAHVFLPFEELEAIRSCQNVKRVVFVGKEEYDTYIDDDVIAKSAYIYNMINTKRETQQRCVEQPSVTYVGSLVPAKGFHLLAKIWPSVLERVSEAQLNVIGTGKVYDRNAVLGKYGIAQESYENEFITYLTDADGKVLPSVHFLGLLGEEKEDVFRKTAVGVVNPTALTETFCISAVEMQLCGVPVVSRKKWGLLDTIKDGKTGFLYNNEQEFVDCVVELLVNKDLNETYGCQAKEFVKNTFEADILIQQWIRLLKEVYEDVPAVYAKVQGNWGNDFKYLRGILRFLRIKLGLRFLPSVETIKQLKGQLR